MSLSCTKKEQECSILKLKKASIYGVFKKLGTDFSSTKFKFFCDILCYPVILCDSL